MTQQQSEQDVWLTQEAYDKLSGELNHLRDVVRAEVVARISAARDEGDLKENGGYHAAREEQGKVEGRIQQLEAMLDRATVGEAPTDDGTVRQGMKVTFKFVGDEDAQTFLLGAREMEDVAHGLDVYSPQSPLGTAILGSSVGDTVSYDAPNGKKVSLEVLGAEPFRG